MRTASTAWSRRGFVAAGGIAVAVSAFDPVRRGWVTPAHADPGLGIPVPPLDGELTVDPAALAEASEDYGHIISRVPVAVLRPGSAEDVATIIRYADDVGVKVAARGVSHSVFGQAQVDSGIVIDMRTLATVHALDASGAWVDAGVRWRKLIEAALSRGLSPRVLADYVELTVGGVLSVGGVGGASHRFGLVVDNVEALEVVTGQGDLLTCSPTDHPVLFRAVLGGLGQCAVITKAKIRLHGAPTMARVYQLIYTDANPYVADQRTLARDRRFDYLEGQIVPAPSGGGFVLVLEGAAYFSSTPPDDGALLAGLTPADGIPPTIFDLPYLAWLNRLAEFEAALRSIGRWETPHPWLDLFLPDRGVEAFMADQIARLTPDDLGAGLGLFYPFRRARPQRTSMVFPRGPGLVWLFDLLRYPPADPTLVDALLADNRARFEQARDFGGKRYPISAVEFSADDWRSHFGPGLARFARHKAFFDPSNILTPGQGIFRG